MITESLLCIRCSRPLPLWGEQKCIRKGRCRAPGFKAWCWRTWERVVLVIDATVFICRALYGVVRGVLAGEIWF